MIEENISRNASTRRALFLLIILFFMGIRAYLFFYKQNEFFYNQHAGATLTGDGFVYDQVARSFINGQGLTFAGKPFSRQIGYPLFLALFYKALGINYKLLVIFQILLSLTTLWLAYRFAQLIYGRSILALLVPLFFVLNFKIATFVQLLYCETLVLFILIVVLLLLYKHITTQATTVRNSLSLAIGLLTGYLILLRPIFYFVPFLVLLYAIVKAIYQKYLKLIGQVILFVFAAFLVIAPVLIYNYKTFGVAKISLNGGGNFNAGMNLTSGGKPGEGIFKEGQELLKSKYHLELSIAELNDPPPQYVAIVDKVAFEAALRRILKHPVGFAGLYLKNVLRMFINLPKAHPVSRKIIYFHTPLSVVALLFLLIGLARFRSLNIPSESRVILVTIYLISAYYLIAGSFFWVFDRLSFPLSLFIYILTPLAFWKKK